ncbi:MAG: leucine-rich repeat domain-containing protein [Muribaculaceae bacterium]
MKANIMTRAILLASVGALMGFAPEARADEPSITIHTNAYANSGAANVIQLTLGSMVTDAYVEVDCGSGTRKFVELVPGTIDAESGTIEGATIQCTVTAEGMVKIYGDASVIDVLDAHGCAITDIDLSQAVNLDILELSNNELESLDLSANTNIRALYLSNNDFSKSPLVVGPKPKLLFLEMNSVGALSDDFSLTDYPELMTFDAWHCLALDTCDPSQCPNLVKLSIDNTNVAALDVTHNTKLQILNISDTRIGSIDLLQCPDLYQFYASHTSGTMNTDVKLSAIDVTHNTKLYYLFLNGNNLTELDLSQNPDLFHLNVRDNQLSYLDLSANTNLYNVDLSGNYLTFNNMPLDEGQWNEYYYSQRAMTMPRSVKVGDTFDFSDKVLRDGTTTGALLYIYSESTPDVPSLVESSKYSYSNGKVTLLEAIPDSVFVQFTNTGFEQYPMTTTKFKVKTAAEYGKPSAVLTFNGSFADGTMRLKVAVDGASADNPKTIYIDPGTGELTSIDNITTAELPAEPNVELTVGNGPKIIYVDDEVMLSGFAIDGYPISSIDLSKQAGLRYLEITNADLYSIDLQYNRCLRHLDLSGNNLTTLALEGINGYYTKSLLADIAAADNQLTSFTLESPLTIHHLDLSGNNLAELDLKDIDNMETLDLSDNQLTSAQLFYGYALRRADLSGNKMTQVTMPEVSVLDYLDLSDNDFTIATVPVCDAAEYIYAPQSPYSIPTKGPGVNLSALATAADGTATTFTWLKTDGTALTDGTDYRTLAPGKFKFVNTEVGDIHCAMTNSALPAFAGDNAYCTTPIEAAAMPQNVVATFTTTEAAEGVLSLAAYHKGTTLYIDWEGDKNFLEQYVLDTQYTLFAVSAPAETPVTVFSYDDDDDMSVFSMRDVKIADVDYSNLTNIRALFLYNAGTPQITMPANVSNLAELTFDNCGITDIDLAQYPSLYALFLPNNDIATIDLSKAPGLGVASMPNSHVQHITLAGNDNLWSLDMRQNELTEIDLSGATGLNNLFLSSNQLSDINVDGLNALTVLYLDQNNFTFATLPQKRDNWSFYLYANQAPITLEEPTDGTVDLSSQAFVGDTATTYAWYLGMPEYNEVGELVGEQLIEDAEYTLTNGVTTFLANFHAPGDAVMCVMTNEALPDVVIYTNLFPVWAAGVADVAADTAVQVSAAAGAIVVTAAVADLPVNAYSANGAAAAAAVTRAGTIALPVSSGLYIVTVADKAFKVAVR